MSYKFRGPKFKGLIAVWEDGNGKTIMVGSKEAYNWSLAFESEPYGGYINNGWHGYAGALDTVTLEITMPTTYISTAEYVSNVPQIARKGIYLPNMTFLALEDKGE